VLLCETAGKFFDEAIPYFKTVASDKNYDVRKTFFQVIFKLLTNFNIIHLRKYEYQLVTFLLIGLSDEKVEISKICAEYIEQAGEYRIVKKLNLQYRD